MKTNFTYKEIWEHQCTILYIANYRFNTLQYLKQEYDKNNQATYHRFVIESMYAFRESVIIDLCKLFIKPYKSSGNDIYKGKNSHLNFYYNIHHYKDEIQTEKFDKIYDFLSLNQDKVNYVLDLRDKEIGHKDLTHSTKHKFHLEDLEILAELIEVAKKIILISYDNYDLRELYSDEDSQPRWAAEVLEALNYHRKEQSEIKFINNLRNSENI